MEAICWAMSVLEQLLRSEQGKKQVILWLTNHLVYFPQVTFEHHHIDANSKASSPGSTAKNGVL